MNKKIAILSGDGIGPEIMEQALRVLRNIDLDNTFQYQHAKIGGAAYDKYGTHFPDETKSICQNSDAILFGAVGGPITQQYLAKWQNCERNSILALRKTFALNVNLRPTKLYATLAGISPLNKNIVQQEIDILIIRELIGDIYFGEHQQFSKNSIRYATDVAEYNETQIKIAAVHAFEAAKVRNKKVTSVDKANVLATSKLWRDVVTEVAANYPDIKLEHMLVDNAAMQIMLNPKQFDVILTANLFGDILSDLASAIPGSLGLMPSASLNQSGFGLYEPSGGSAPTIADKNIANPIGQILSAAMMLQYSFNMPNQAKKIESAVKQTLNAGILTKDLCTNKQPNVGTVEITDAILKNLGR